MVGTQQDARLVIELAKLAAMSATTGYERSATNLGVVAGDVDAGLAVALTVSV
jgi:hypothetical protein